jgi:hypothetical protein
MMNIFAIIAIVVVQDATVTAKLVDEVFMNITSDSDIGLSNSAIDLSDSDSAIGLSDSDSAIGLSDSDSDSAIGLSDSDSDSAIGLMIVLPVSVSFICVWAWDLTS